MARINQALLARLQKQLGLSRRRVYSLVEEKVRQTHLPRPLAAIALASENGINISRFTSPEELAAIRQAAVSGMPRPVVTPERVIQEKKLGQVSQAPRNRGVHLEVRQVGGRLVAEERLSEAKKRAYEMLRAPRPAGPKGRRPVTSQRRKDTSVFVVHGRNEKARKSIFEFLRALGLQPIEWNQAIKMTTEPTPYVGTILETAFKEAAAVVVLLTPDDEARLRKKYRKVREPRHERQLTGQARPNVLFEAGMAIGRNPRNTVLVQVGTVKEFSDVAGRHIVRLGNDFPSRQALATRLENAGCKVDTSGTDWHLAGDFRS